MARTKVVNIRADDYDVDISRPGRWGNPFRIPIDGNRPTVIKKHRKWFMRRLLREPELWIALRHLRGKRLGCHCKPEACHGDLLALLADKF